MDGAGEGAEPDSGAIGTAGTGGTGYRSVEHEADGAVAAASDPDGDGRLLMEAAALVTTLRSRGARLHVLEGGRLGVEPRRVLTDDLRSEIRIHKSAILSLLASEAASPAARLEAAWASALERAREGFAAAGRLPISEDLVGAARLELALDREVVPPCPKSSGRVARQLLREVYVGRLIARVGTDGLAHVGLSVDALDLDPAPPSEPEPPLGKMRCHGCLELAPEHRGSYCFGCATGADASLPSKLMPAAIELLELHGPAGARGVRLERIRERARERRCAMLGGRSSTPRESRP